MSPLSPDGGPVLPQLDPDEAVLLGGQIEDLRGMAQRGESIGIGPGIGITWWGVVICAGMLAFLAQEKGFLPGRINLNMPMYALGYGGSAILRFCLRRHLTRSWRSQAMNWVWIFVGAVFIMHGVAMAVTHAAHSISDLALMPFLYGVVMAVMAAVSQRLWIIAVSGLWLVVAGLTYTIPDIGRFEEMMAAAAVALFIVPGVVILRNEWRARLRRWDLFG